jgi:thiamine-phosphate pyrophosphorylase
MPLAVPQQYPLMCLTQDNLPWSHAEQARRLCVGGARWLQVRIKKMPIDLWLSIAREVVAVCREYGAICIVNDSVEVALAAEADGVHLGKHDLDWVAARERLGPTRLLGGTINHSDDVRRARAANCLDYVGVGPWRFTANKQNLSPILSAAEVSALVAGLSPLPAWIIGGIEVADLPAVSRTGAAGVAISSALFRDGKVAENLAAFLQAWPLEPRVGGEPLSFVKALPVTVR